MFIIHKLFYTVFTYTQKIIVTSSHEIWNNFFIIFGNLYNYDYWSVDDHLSYCERRRSSIQHWLFLEIPHHFTRGYEIHFCTKLITAIANLLVSLGHHWVFELFLSPPQVNWIIVLYNFASFRTVSSVNRGFIICFWSD